MDMNSSFLPVYSTDNKALSSLMMSSSGTVRNRRAAVENEAPLPLRPSIPTADMQRDRIKPLSGKPYFNVILTRLHLSPRYLMALPADICLELPSDAVRTVFNHQGKSCELIYRGHNVSFKSLDGWREFAKDNCLKVGDACIFELMENSKEKLIFEVQVLRGDIPSKFLGGCAEEPIVIL